MIQAATDGSSSDNGSIRVEQLLGDPPNPARWRWALPLAVAVLALVPPAAQSEAQLMPDAATQGAEQSIQDGPGQTILAAASPAADRHGRPADDRVSSRRSRSRPTAGSSPPRTPMPRVRGSRSLTCGPAARSSRSSRREIGQGGVGSVAFSPDGTKLLWGEYGGEVALWDLAGDRLLFREKAA